MAEGGLLGFIQNGFLKHLQLVDQLFRGVHLELGVHPNLLLVMLKDASLVVLLAHHLRLNISSCHESKSEEARIRFCLPLRLQPQLQPGVAFPDVEGLTLMLIY